jgi:outer membrane receptor protein involved in Fe transport
MNLPCTLLRFAHFSTVCAALGLPRVGSTQTIAARSDSADGDVFELAEFTVLSDRAPAADNSELEARRLQTTESFTGVTREEFGRRANRRAGDIVARLPGVFMGGPPGENKDARLRGLDKEFARTQVDGLSLPDGGEKRELQLNRVPADLIQEVRVLRNPSPEFESDGLAGRLDFRFRSIPEQKLTGEMRLGSGRRDGTDGDRWLGSVVAGGRVTEHLGVLGSFFLLEDPTYKAKTEDEFAATGAARKRTAEHEAKPTTSRDFFADLAWRYGDGEIHLKPLRLSTLEEKVKTRTTLDLGKPAAADESRELERERKDKVGEGLSLLQVHRFDGDRRTLDSRLSWQRVTEGKDAKTVESFTEKDSVLGLAKRTVENEDKEDRTVSFDTKYAFTAGGDAHFLKLGAAYRARDRHRLKTRTEASAPAFVAVDRTGPKDNYLLAENYVALFVQDTWKAAETLTVLGGARVERVDFAARTPTAAEVERRFTDFNPSTQLLWRPRADTAVKFSVSRALNRPKFDELSPYEQNDGKRIVRGNPALAPARAWKHDLGVEFGREQAFLAVHVFQQEITGLIESVETGALGGPGGTLPVVQVSNVGDGRVRGVELEQRVGFGWSGLAALRRLTLWSNQAWLDSELKETATGRTRRFSGQPRFLANLGLDYEVGRFYATISARHVGRRPGDDASADVKEQAAEWPVDAALHVRLTAALSLFVEGNNLTDERKVETTFKTDGSRLTKTEATGRAWFAGARYQF